MKDQIDNRDQKETFWRQRGILKIPKSPKQGHLVIAAQDYIEKLSCHSEVRRRLAIGEKPRDVAIFIQQHNELPNLTFNSIKKYTQVYRSFCIPPTETLQTQVTELRPNNLAIWNRQLDALAGGIKEIELMEELIRVQDERVHNQIQLEKQLGMPVPGMRLEIETQQKLLITSTNKKIELGIYSRAPQNGQPGVYPRSILDGTPPFYSPLREFPQHEREQIVAVTKEILILIHEEAKRRIIEQSTIRNKENHFSNES